MKINSDINKSLKVANKGKKNMSINEILYSLSKENSGGDISGPVSIYDCCKNLIEYVERNYLNDSQFDSTDLINDLNQFKTMKYNLEIEIQKKYYLGDTYRNNKMNDRELYYNLNIVNSIIYTLESLKEEIYLKTIIKSVKDMINNIIDDQKLIK